MEEKPYFVMLTTQAGWLTPLVDENGEVCGFETVNDAIVAGSNNLLGEAFGFEVFENGGGVDFR